MANLIDVYTKLELVQFNVNGVSVPVIAVTIPEGVTDLTADDNWYNLIFDTFVGETIAASIYVGNKTYWPEGGAASDYTNTYEGNVFTYDYGASRNTAWVNVSYRYQGNTHTIILCVDDTGYGQFSMEPFTIICVGDYNAIAYGDNSNAYRNIGGYYTFSEDPGLVAFDSHIVGCTLQPFGSIRSSTRNFSISGTFVPDEPPVPPTPSSDDPFSPGGTTGDDETDPEGGEGNFENAEVTVDPPALPGLSAVTSGFIAAYMPSFAQLQRLGDYLWSDLFSLDTFKKLFNDPMQAILGLSLVPVAPSTADGNVVIGNVNTGITMPRVMQQFVTVDCGSVTLPEYWGGYLDYSPYTKVEIYLPYIGVRPLDTDEVMGRTLHVVYHVDVLSGACVCFIQCDNTIRYHYVGQCGASIPITANDWTRVVNGAVSIATALGVGVATLGAGAAAGGVTAASMAGTGALVGGIASQVLASKPRVEHSGSLAGMGGLLGVQFPYIMIQRPRQAVPSGQNAFTGYPSFIKRTLSTVTGYTQVTGVHLTGLSCTDEEKKEIQAYLEAGVIL